jgi:hypothetical protein
VLVCIDIHVWRAAGTAHCACLKVGHVAVLLDCLLGLAAGVVAAVLQQLNFNTFCFAPPLHVRLVLFVVCRS